MATLEESYAYAKRLTRKRARNFYFTFLLLPPHRRRSIFAVYAFSRRADDAVDAVEAAGSSGGEAREALARLRSFLRTAPVDADPLIPSLRDTIDRFAVPLEHFEELLAGMEMDLTKKSYATFEEARQYCYRAASVIGLISIQIFGHEGPASLQPAVESGIAMQLTNVLRDINEDLGRGRVYIPAEDMERFGYTSEELHRKAVNDRFRSLLSFEVAKARECFRSAEGLYPLVHRESRHCPILLMRFYSRILDKIEAQNYDVFARRPSLALHEKLWLLGKTWLEARRRTSPARSYIQKEVT